MAASRHRHFESDAQDAFNLGTGVDVSVVGPFAVLILLAEVHAAGELTDDNKVSTTQQFLLQRRLVEQAVESGYGAHVGKESQLLAHSQQPRLGPNLQCRVVVVLQVAYGSKEYGIGTHTDVVGTIRIRVAKSLNGTGTDQCLLVGELVSALLGNGVHHGHALFHNFRTYSVARKDGNLQFHNCWFNSFSIMLSILKVALMAASVWSASSPRVRSSRPLSFQVITVCTRASVRPPGGMVTA